MLNYEKLYRILFNGLTDAIECLENEGGILRAKDVLINAQQAAEAYYISAEEEAGPTLPAGASVPVYILPHDAY